MKNLLFLLLIQCSSFYGFAQVNTDSLWRVWNDTTQVDTQRLRAIDQIAQSGQNLDSVLQLRSLEYDLAKSSGNKLWMGKALVNMGVLYKRQFEYPEALDYFTRAAQVIEETGNSDELRRVLYNIGVIHFDQGDFEQALAYYTQSLEVNEGKGNKVIIASTLLNIGIVYMYQGQYVPAIDYCFRSLKKEEELGNKAGMASVMNVIGLMYSYQGAYGEALDYQKRAYALNKELGIDDVSAGNLINIANIYQKQGVSDQAIDYYTQGIAICEAIGEKGFLANAFAGMGEVYRSEGNYAKALESTNRFLKINEELGNQKGVAEGLVYTGVYHSHLKNYDKAISNLNRGLALAQEIGVVGSIRDGAKELHKIYKTINRPSLALEMHELYIEIRDSIKNEENTEAILQQELKHEYEKKALTDSLAQVEQTLNMQMAYQAQLHQKDQNRNILLGIGAIVLLVAVGLWSRNRNTQRTNTQLQAAKERAERSERFKEQFLANMSHEIRTPMHAISGMVNILKRNEYPATQTAFLDAMDTSADNLLILLNDILDLSKVEAGKLEVETIPMAPAEVIDNVYQILQFKAAEKGLTLNYQIAEDIPQLVTGDPTRLNQILTNLAGNAIKFTEKGEVNIRLSKKSDFLLFEVQDTGIGIPEDRLQSIFDAFKQGDRATARAYGGTGLGLNISRQLVELQGGNIWVESELGKGSIFFVTLPLIPVAGETVASMVVSEAQLAEMAAALKGLRVLIAEDNEFNQMVIQDDLSYYLQDTTLDIAPNGRQAVEKYQTGTYDLVLMDVQMPEMDGYEASLGIRQWEKENGKPSVPIIAMTASVLKSEINLCLEAGMDNYIPKPYKMEELIGTIYGEVKRK